MKQFRIWMQKLGKIHERTWWKQKRIPCLQDMNNISCSKDSSWVRSGQNTRGGRFHPHIIAIRSPQTSDARSLRLIVRCGPLASQIKYYRCSFTRFKGVKGTWKGSDSVGKLQHDWRCLRSRNASPCLLQQNWPLITEWAKVHVNAYS